MAKIILSVVAGLGIFVVSVWYIYDHWNRRKRKPSLQNTALTVTGQPVSRSVPGSSNYDIILLYSEVDFKLAEEVRNALIDNVQIKNVRVALYEDVIVGETKFQPLFDRGNYIFLLLSQNYNGDPEAAFKGQMHLAHSLKKEDAKSRIVPVSTERGVSRPEWSVIQAMPYYRYKEDRKYKGCFDAVENLIVKGRTNKNFLNRSQ